MAESNDGLCAADSAQQRITVVCPVITDFMLPEVTFLKPDTAYVFENTSVATTDRIWSINGSDVATTADLSISFPTPGLYTICLSANNGFCEDDHCRSVFVREPPCTGPGCAEDCGGPFLFPYLTTGGALTSGQFYQVIPFAGGYYAAGGMNNQPMVVALDEAGALLWQIELFPELPSGFVSRLLLDQDGNLTGIGTSGYANGSGVQQTGSFAFKLDARNGDLLWARQYGSQQAVVQLTDLTHSAPGADYFLCGYLQDFGTPGGRTALTLFLDPADGTIRSANTFPATGGPNDLLDLTYDPTQDRYYAVGYQEGGISGRGLAVLALDGAGALAWSSQLTETLGGSFPANLASIDQDDDELVVLSPSQSTATGATASLWRVAKADGLLSERLRYTLPAGTLAGQITSLSDGYQCAGVLPDGEPILWRTDKAGIPIWASIYPDLGGGDFTLTGSGQVLLATSWREDPARFPTVTRLGADGAVPADCLEEEPIDVSFGPLLARNPPATLSTIPVNISSFEFFAEPGSLSLSPENCREECPEENPCLAPLLTNYESTENLSGNSNVRALVADTARTYLSVVNQSGGSVIAVDGNGEISWQVRMQASNLYLDREGNLIAHDARNIARFRANDGTVLWSQELTGENVTWGIRRAYVPDAGDGLALFG
ncbi:MAG: PQQ-binding-like beta-propeller repeat protein, partial [Bacteroidota bacterium]